MTPGQEDAINKALSANDLWLEADRCENNRRYNEQSLGPLEGKLLSLEADMGYIESADDEVRAVLAEPEMALTYSH